jgi:hypothetical protein
MKKTILPFLAIFVFFVFVEIILRISSLFINIYPLEMLKYALELKQSDPQGKLTHVHIPNSRTQLMGQDIQINSLGCRGKELRSESGSIVVMGSSITLGWGVKESETFSSLLEQALDRQVLNCGIGNYNLEQEIELLNRILQNANPEKVIIHYFVNDIEEITLSSFSFLFQRSFALSYAFEKVLSIYYQFIFGGSLLYYESLYSNVERTNSLDSQLDKLASIPLPMTIVIIPNLSSLTGSTREGLLYIKIENIFKKKGFSVLNTYPDFKRQFSNNLQDLWVQSDDPHPNARGHKLIFDSYMSFKE